MKFIHLSDLHLLPHPQTIRGIDVIARLEAAVDSIGKNFSDAELCMVTGDLTDMGDAESYGDVRRILDRLPMPWHALMGNHDIRSVAQAELPDLPWHADGSLQYELTTDAGEFLILDSLVTREIGRLCETRLAWLKERLTAAEQAGRDVYLFLHHVPFDIGMRWLDGIKLENGDQFQDVLKGFSNIRHMFFGHVHRPVHGSWHGVPFSTVRATVHQAALQFGDTHLFIEENPSYAVVLIDDTSVLIHDHSYLEEYLPITK